MVHADVAGGKSVQRVRQHAPNLFTHALHKLSIGVIFFGVGVGGGTSKRHGERRLITVV